MSATASVREQELASDAFQGSRVGFPIWTSLVTGAAGSAVCSWLVWVVNHAFPGQPERVCLLVGALCGLTIAGCIAFDWFRARRLEAERSGRLVLAAAAIWLVGVCLYCLSFYVAFPADILCWSESDFVNDIIKFRMSHPLYTAQAENESFVYPPGSQIITYLLASAFGKGASVPAYRWVQLSFTILAACFGLHCASALRSQAGKTDPRSSPDVTWGIFGFAALFLIATNPTTNHFIVLLHNDALSQLVTVLAYCLLIRYAITRNHRLLVAMAILPAAGLLIKQSLVIWVLFYAMQVLLFSGAGSVRRALLLVAASISLVAATFGACYFAWGEHFVYWMFTVLSRHTVSPIRSFQHVVAVWPFFAAGLFGGWVLIRNRANSVLLGPWLVWLILIGAETYTSGIAWMLNHIGPGSLIAGAWFVAGLSRIWPSLTRGIGFAGVLRSALVTAGVLLVFAGFDTVRAPVPPVSQSSLDYVKRIEVEASKGDPATVLIDAGSWMYLPRGIVMKDRAPSIGERGYSETGDFSAFIRRLQNRQYSRILVRNFNEPDFWYDHSMWSTPSGIKKVLLENYEVVATIPGVTPGPGSIESPYLFGEISVLSPSIRASVQ